MKRMKWVTLLVVTGLLFGVAGIATAQDAPDGGEPATVVTDDQVNAIANQLYCPVCENIPLDVCGTQACADWRGEIRVMLEEGRTEAEIKAYFAERYGRRVLANPQAEGIDVMLWVLPPLALVIGLVVLFVVLRRMAPGVLTETLAPDAALSYAGLDPAYVERIENDLREMAGSSAPGR